jgi:hypothetical protein
VHHLGGINLPKAHDVSNESQNKEKQCDVHDAHHTGTDVSYLTVELAIGNHAAGKGDAADHKGQQDHQHLAVQQTIAGDKRFGNMGKFHQGDECRCSSPHTIKKRHQLRHRSHLHPFGNQGTRYGAQGNGTQYPTYVADVLTILLVENDGGEDGQGHTHGSPYITPAGCVGVAQHF